MENSVRMPVFFEFYGLPGCGKSTVSHAVARLLREDGYTVEEPSFKIDHQNIIIKKTKKLTIAFWGYCFHHKTYQKIIDLVRRNGYSGKELFTQTVNVFQKIKTYNEISSTRIFIWDQGIIQAAISLSIKGRISACDNYSVLLSFIKQKTRIISVFIPATIQVALERMGRRKTNYSRVEKVNDIKQKVKMLEKFQEGVVSIKGISDKPIDSIVVKNTHSIEEQVYDIIQAIYSFMPI